LPAEESDISPLNTAAGPSDSPAMAIALAFLLGLVPFCVATWYMVRDDLERHTRAHRAS
jgi:hypothetical protein